MFKYPRIFLAVLAIFLITGCDNGGTGSGSGGTDVGVVEEATPPDGKVTLQCATFEWWVRDNGDAVTVKVFFGRRDMGSVALNADNPQRSFHYHFGKCTAFGSLAMYAKSTWGSGRLEARNITIEQGTASTTHTGTLATW